jgi:hypothetical protein
MTIIFFPFSFFLFFEWLKDVFKIGKGFIKIHIVFLGVFMWKQVGKWILESTNSDHGFSITEEW